MYNEDRQKLYHSMLHWTAVIMMICIAYGQIINNIITQPVLPPAFIWTPFMDNLEHFNHTNHSTSILLALSYTRKALIFNRNVPFPPFPPFSISPVWAYLHKCTFQCCPWWGTAFPWIPYMHNFNHLHHTLHKTTQNLPILII